MQGFLQLECHVWILCLAILNACSGDGGTLPCDTEVVPQKGTGRPRKRKRRRGRNIKAPSPVHAAAEARRCSSHRCKPARLIHRMAIARRYIARLVCRSKSGTLSSIPRFARSYPSWISKQESILFRGTRDVPAEEMHDQFLSWVGGGGGADTIRLKRQQKEQQSQKQDQQNTLSIVDAVEALVHTTRIGVLDEDQFTPSLLKILDKRGITPTTQQNIPCRTVTTESRQPNETPKQEARRRATSGSSLSYSSKHSVSRAKAGKHQQLQRRPTRRTRVATYHCTASSRPSGTWRPSL